MMFDTRTRPLPMHLDVAALRLQIWRAEKLYAAFVAYARAIGCTVIHDEIMSDGEQARKLATWWTERTT